MALSTLAEAAIGTLIKMCSDANGTSPTTIAECRDIDDTLSMATEDVTPQTATDRKRRKIATLIDHQIEFKVNWLPTEATHGDTSGILYVFDNGLERTWQLVESDGTIWEFNAIISNIKGGRPVAGARNASITLQGTGDIDYSKT